MTRTKHRDPASNELDGAASESTTTDENETNETMQSIPPRTLIVSPRAEENGKGPSIPTVSGQMDRPLDVTFFEPFTGKDYPPGKCTPGSKGKAATYDGFIELAVDLASLVTERRVDWHAYDDEQAAKAQRTLMASLAATGKEPTPEQLRHVTRVARIDAAKGRLLGFSPVTFAEDYRKKENVRHCSAYAGDFDEMTSEQWANALAMLKAAGVAYLAYGSPKDAIPKKLEAPEVCVKRRLLLPLSRDVMPKEAEHLQRVIPHLLGLKFDTSTYDASRLFYVGTIGDSAPVLEDENGEALDVDALLKIALPEVTKPGKGAKAKGAKSSRPGQTIDRVPPCPANLTPSEYGAELCRSMAPAIEGEQGSAALLRVARALHWGLQLEADECQELLESIYNDRCVPPWTTAEITHKIESARREDGAPYASGALLGSGAPGSSTSPLLLTRDGRCFIRRGESNTYDPPLAQRDLATRLVNLGIDQSYDIPRRDSSINVAATLEKFAVVAMHLERDFCATGITWSKERETLIEGYELPRIEPVRDAEVEAWLSALAGGAIGELYDWIAGCRQDRLHQPGAALALLGDPDLGKTLLASALSAMWGARVPVELKDTVGQFDGVKTECPIWFDDECEAIKKGDVSSDNFRQLLQAREHYYEKKNQEKRRLRGCARVILACNEPSDIRFSDVAGPAAVQAIIDRMALFVVPRDQTPVVHAALNRLRRNGEQDVDLARVTRHMAWVQASVQPRTQRFLGARSDTSAAKRAAYAGTIASAPALFDLIREYLTDGGRADRAYQTSAPAGAGDYRLATTGDDLLALPSALVAHLTMRGVRTDLAAVQKALGPFRKGEDRVQKRFGGRDGFQARFWALDTEALCLAMGLSDDETNAAINTINDCTSDRLPTPKAPKLRAVTGGPLNGR